MERTMKAGRALLPLLVLTLPILATRAIAGGTTQPIAGDAALAAADDAAPAIAPAEPPAEPAPARPDALAAEPAAARQRPFALRWNDFELHARFMGNGYSERAEGTSSSDLEAEDIRVALRWQPRAWVRGLAEVDFSDVVNRWFDANKVHVRDAYLEFRPGRFRIRGGEFKSPISPLEMESPWDVPASNRGLLSDVLRFSFGIAGRKPGLELRWNPKGPLAAAVAVQRATSTRGERVGDESFDNVAQDWSALTTTARLAWEGKRLAIGGAFDWRPAEPVPGGGYQHFWTAGADLSWRVASRAGARVWAEGYAGSSWQDVDPYDGRSTTFLAGRVLAAWSFFLQERRAPYVEPCLMGALLEPDTSVTDDLVWELSGGLHFGSFGHLRFVLEAQHRSVSPNTPPALGLAPLGGPPATSRTRFVAQIGAAF